jgi:hypothetical protein
MVTGSKSKRMVGGGVFSLYAYINVKKIPHKVLMSMVYSGWIKRGGHAAFKFNIHWMHFIVLVGNFSFFHSKEAPWEGDLWHRRIRLVAQ